jgi:hypothetical protein
MGNTTGLQVKDLSVGSVYKCQLSSCNVLIIETEAKTAKDEEGKEHSIPSVKAGKIAILHESGDMKFILIELHDGQLIEKN